MNSSDQEPNGRGSFFSRLFRRDKGEPTPPKNDPVASREPIPRAPDEGKKNTVFPTNDRCGVVFLFDYDRLQGAYGQHIFQILWSVLKNKLGRCVFADGDLKVSAGILPGDPPKLGGGPASSEVVPTYANGPLSLVVSGDLERFDAYAIAVFQEDHYTKGVHNELMRKLKSAYLGCLLLQETFYSLAQFQELVDFWGLVCTMEFSGGTIVQNRHGIDRN